MPEEICPKCGGIGYRSWLWSATAFRCAKCGYREPASSLPGYSQEDFEADIAVLENAYGPDDSGNDSGYDYGVDGNGYPDDGDQ